MINKFNKIINNKFARLFRFFFIRYLVGAFFISIVLFLITPHFFDYKKKLGIIELFLLKNYGFKIQKAENIKYKAFPTPHLELSTVEQTLIQKI